MSSPVQTSPTQPDRFDRASYYTAALRALRFIEQRRRPPAASAARPTRGGAPFERDRET